MISKLCDINKIKENKKLTFSGIYIIQNKVNGKVYIGQSKNIYKRIQKHYYGLKKNSGHNLHLQNAWNKYGSSSFYFDVLDQCHISELDKKEIYWISKFNSINRCYGYNKEIGGKSSPTHSDSIKLMSDSKTGVFISINDQEKLQIVDMIKNTKYSMREIAKFYGVSRTVIYNVRDKYQLSRHRRIKHYKIGHFSGTASEISKQLDIDTRVFHARIRNKYYENRNYNVEITY